MKTAWYIGCPADAVGDRAILIGDPDRIDRISSLLDDVEFLPVKRGLRTITGYHSGKKITVTAFGMGAPIATIVLHELADLGVRYFLRIGTAMYFPPTQGGAFLLSDRALSFEGTSRSYAPDPQAFRADAALTRACELSAETWVSPRPSACSPPMTLFIATCSASMPPGRSGPRRTVRPCRQRARLPLIWRLRR